MEARGDDASINFFSRTIIFAQYKNGAADISGWYFPYVVCTPIFPIAVKLLSEDKVLLQDMEIFSLHRWNYPLVNGVFHKLRTECS